MSKLRQWADRDYANKNNGHQNEQRLVGLLSDSLIWGITRFGNSRKKEARFPAEYDNDFTIFEWATYVYYHILCWYQDQNAGDDQMEVLSFLVRDFADRYEKEVGIKGVFEVMTDRFQFYGGLDDNDESDSIPFHLEQLIKKSCSERVLLPYEGCVPVLIGDLSESMSLKASIKAYEKNMIPGMIRSVIKFYEMIEP